MRKYKIPHQQLIHWLLTHSGQPVMECSSVNESGTRNHYWSVFGSKAIVTVTVANENLCYLVRQVYYLMLTTLKKSKVNLMYLQCYSVVLESICEIITQYKQWYPNSTICNML